MTPGVVSTRVMGRRLKMIQDLLEQMRELPLESLEAFLADSRNYRLVHFYDEVNANELYQICTQELGDIEQICDAYRRWIKQHPDKVEQA